ncbi:MAG: DUF1697 domain-containing protein [Oligoflexia bacterium]|nr:DUF1697 domain-containing protein [Oligoflexia bacterium]
MSALGFRIASRLIDSRVVAPDTASRRGPARIGIEMPTFIALLRGINVGKAKRVPMAALRSLLSDLGYTGVTTLLNSGNAVFHATGRSPARHAADIAAAISERCQFDVPVLVKTRKELDCIVSENPITADPQQHSRLLVVFVQDTSVLSSMTVLDPPLALSEQFVIGKNAGYLFCPDGILKSKAGKAILGSTGRVSTTRNWATVLKLHALAHESPE